MLLSVSKLRKHYGGVDALSDVSFDLNEGMVVALLGNNGAGKSSLVKCITGVETPDGGEITFQGSRLASGSPYSSRRAGIEMIYQSLNLCPQQDAVANIFLGRELHFRLGPIVLPFINRAAMLRRAKELLGSINAEIPVFRPVGTLSGGQQQAVAICRALLFQPKLLILDEPTSALGVKETEKVLEIIRTLKSQGMAMIIISHRLSEVLELADKVVLLRHGRVRQNCSASQISLAELTQLLAA